MLNHDEENGCDFSYDEAADAFVVEWLGAGEPPGPGAPTRVCVQTDAG